MGYPQPNTPYRCQINFSPSGALHIEFRTIDWGDRVQFKIYNKQVVVTLRQYWGSKTETYESSN